MGGSYRIQLAAGEAKKVNNWLSSLKEDDLTMRTTDDGHEYVSRVWIDPCKTNIVEIGYSFGGNENGELAKAIGFELMQRLNFKKWGWDSVGWVAEGEMEAFGMPRAFLSQIDLWRKTISRMEYTGAELKYATDTIEHLIKQTLP
jgi:hypothetical protein